ncbi:PucR family transcriptional regulator [Peribacillus muralis]|uniref:PucR family transcriptional regulator n=1 Tax=Peribacillus muralis TaxID=264697 RepID=UPI001F4EA4AA|nr:helix-turn-helix domain-containing protein [Peribacillus muralis]MCK1993132.1 helix-turn-helix domain-containing protein [Peribacillus muralis]MCK2013686.1 helix-turn-helix domain-containing protein [Peribacillus muralis]
MKEFEKNRDIFKDLYGDMMEFADRISSVLGCPITIEDGNHRLLAYSTHDDTTDQARIMTIIGRRVPEKVINSLWKDGFIPALLKEDVPIKIGAINDVGLGNRAAVSIRKNNEVLGFIWALEVHAPFSDEDMEFLQFAAKEAKNQLQQLQLKKKRKEAGHQEFLWRMLTGHYTEEAEIIENFTKFSIHVPKIFSILVFEFPKEINREVERYISYMLTTTQKINSSLFAIDQNKLILFAGANQENSPFFTTSLYDFIPFFILEMKRRFGVEHILGTAGQTYSNLLDVKSSYEESQYTLRMKNIFPDDMQLLVHYEELGMFQMIEAFAGHKQRHAHPSILKLKAYDMKNQTELLQTLAVYLEKDCNPNEASRNLHIHVNTLNYRLKRISEVGAIRLKDPIQKMALFLNIKLDQYDAFFKKNS